MKGIQDFFDALSTAGGSVFVWFVMWVLFGAALIIFAFHPNVDHDTKQIVVTGFGSSLTALAFALKSNSSKQQMIDRTISSNPTAAAKLAAAETPSTDAPKQA